MCEKVSCDDLNLNALTRISHSCFVLAPGQGIPFEHGKAETDSF